MQTGSEQAVQMLQTMAQMQEAHNIHVHPDWRTNGYEYYRAIWVECAEMLDHYGWKWWKKQDPDLEQVKLELVDIWHFALSELLRADQLTDEMGIQLAGLELAEQAQPEAFRLAIEQMAASSLTTRSFVLDHFAQAMQTLPMGFAELYSLYIGKNVLNNFRQDHGYKTGTYAKLWHGREDNEHLIEVLAELADAGADLPEQLYAALQARYPAT